MPSPAELIANRLNALLSTGPKTETGKKRSSLNATRHVLTGRVVVLPAEDMAAYKLQSEEIRKSLNPKTALEVQFAQTVADCQWRLNRIRSIEDGMLGLAHDEPTGNFSADHPSIHSAFTAAKTFRENSQAFVNLSIYEQRIARHQKEALRQLKELQAERKAREAQALEEAILLRKANEIKALPFDPGLHQSTHGFVYSAPEMRGCPDYQAGCAAAGLPQHHLRHIPSIAETPGSMAGDQGHAEPVV